MDSRVEAENLEYRWSAGVLYADNHEYAGIKTKNFREYRLDEPDGVQHAADFEYGCPKCGKWHEHKERQKNPVMVMTLIAPCGFTAPFPGPALEPETTANSTAKSLPKVP